MEHGAVWLTYRPDLPAAQVKVLTAFLRTYVQGCEQTPEPGAPCTGGVMG
jgi:hypothetical protein